MGQWIVGVISFQKIFGLCGLRGHKVEIRWDVTIVDNGRTECEDRAILKQNSQLDFAKENRKDTLIFCEEMCLQTGVLSASVGKLTTNRRLGVHSPGPGKVPESRPGKVPE